MKKRKEKMDFNMMSRMRRRGVTPLITRQTLGRRGVSRPQKGYGVGGKKRVLPTLIDRQRGRGKKLKAVGRFFGSDIGKQVLAASVSSVAQNAENPYVKSFGTSMADRMKDDRDVKKKQNKKTVHSDMSPVSSSSSYSSGLSDEELLEALARNQRGRGFFDTLGRIGKVVYSAKDTLDYLKKIY